MLVKVILQKLIDGIKERKMKMIDFSRKKALYVIWME